MAHELEPGWKLARLSFHKEGRAFTRLARLRRRSKARARASVFLESGGDGYGAGPALAFKGAEEFAPSGPDNAPSAYPLDSEDPNM